MTADETDSFPLQKPGSENTMQGNRQHTQQLSFQMSQAKGVIHSQELILITVKDSYPTAHIYPPLSIIVSTQDVATKHKNSLMSKEYMTDC